MPLATVKNTLSAVVDQVEGTHERVVITRKGISAAVLISPADLASLEETLDVLSDPGTMQRLHQFLIHNPLPTAEKTLDHQ